MYSDLKLRTYCSRGGNSQSWGLVVSCIAVVGAAVVGAAAGVKLMRWKQKHALHKWSGCISVAIYIQ